MEFDNPLSHAIVDSSATEPSRVVVQLCSSERQAWAALSYLDRFYDGCLLVMHVVELDSYEIPSATQAQ